ncbi:MAG: hypothetical protein LBN27_05180 [Prevotellaceae bacterium]|jgi:hypothetical protein|nr:hypothetical protein [Prevotellaceae bacterium]
MLVDKKTTTEVAETYLRLRRLDMDSEIKAILIDTFNAAAYWVQVYKEPGLVLEEYLKTKN